MNLRNSSKVSKKDAIEEILRNRHHRHQKIMLSIDPVNSVGGYDFDDEPLSLAQRDAINRIARRH